MKKLLVFLNKNDQAYIFCLIGLICIVFAENVALFSPFLIGVIMTFYGGINLLIEIILNGKSFELRIGDNLIMIILGIILLVEVENTLAIMGILWAFISLKEIGEEIDEMLSERCFSKLRILVCVISTIFAIMLMVDPFHHFIFHIRVLGIEMILDVFMIKRHQRKLKEKRKL
ncbi:hypothetical protein [Lachnobacterium bovis]|uniref:Acid-resistance membrane protein n=1 Tax=Lachnobacterium bovis DSM 14045 TaxID=1122142 RepID=A0A1H3LUI9_9FIRM|nr:hypothetical protein [Lachnobacterium bovis]SDY68051.1 hypothetical protein SAMN02910414_02121 [Lachnobacterium bovis DSM 14045]